jgi:hypothetical protein
MATYGRSCGTQPSIPTRREATVNLAEQLRLATDSAFRATPARTERRTEPRLLGVT